MRIDAVAHVEQHLGAGHVADVRVHLAGEDREILDAKLLGELDFGVPVGTLHEAHHDLAVKSLGKTVEVAKDLRRALAVRLHDHAEPVPALEAFVAQNGLDNVERQVEPVLLFGIDVETDLCLGGHACQFETARHNLLGYRLAVGRLIAGRERGKLDGNARIVTDVAPRCITDSFDGVGVAGKKGLRVGVGSGRLTQHVVGIRVALLALSFCLLEPLLNRLA